MGQIPILSEEQKKCLNQIRKNDFIRTNFYLTGGTALSEYYLQHRYSEDLDFFSEKKYDPQIITRFISELSKKFKINFKEKQTEIARMFFLEFDKSSPLKIDFVYSIDKRLEKGKSDKGIVIDSFLDIAVNKITTINDRLNVKDFVDYYFLSEHFSVWDLIEGARIKCRRDIDPWTLSADFLGVESFSTMPKMIKSLTLEELKNFFRQKAKELGKKVSI